MPVASHDLLCTIHFSLATSDDLLLAAALKTRILLTFIKWPDITMTLLTCRNSGLASGMMHERIMLGFLHLFGLASPTDLCIYCHSCCSLWLKKPVDIFSRVCTRSIRPVISGRCHHLHWGGGFACVCVFVTGICKWIPHMRANQIFIIARESSCGADCALISHSDGKTT